MVCGIFCFNVITSTSSPPANKHRSINPTINWSTNKRVSQSVRPTMANKQKSKQASKQASKQRKKQPQTHAHNLRHAHTQASLFSWMFSSSLFNRALLAGAHMAGIRLSCFASRWNRVCQGAMLSHVAMLDCMIHYSICLMETPEINRFVQKPSLKRTALIWKMGKQLQTWIEDPWFLLGWLVGRYFLSSCAGYVYNMYTFWEMHYLMLYVCIRTCSHLYRHQIE